VDLPSIAQKISQRATMLTPILGWMEQWPFMAEPQTLLFGQIAPPTANVPPARKPDCRVVVQPCSWSARKPRPECVASHGAGFWGTRWCFRHTIAA
jgi:hypothetical protein